jgi:hypothetical protein
MTRNKPLQNSEPARTVFEAVSGNSKTGYNKLQQSELPVLTGRQDAGGDVW